MTLYKDKYPPKSAYNSPTTQKHESPCMMDYWRNQPIRQGVKREEIDFQEKMEELE